MGMHCYMSPLKTHKPWHSYSSVLSHTVFSSPCFYTSAEVNTTGYMLIITIHLLHEYEFVQKLSCGYERKAVFVDAISHELIMFKVNQQSMAFQCCSLLIFNKLNAVSVLTSWLWISKHTVSTSVNYLILSVYMYICLWFWLIFCTPRIKIHRKKKTLNH